MNPEQVATSWRRAFGDAPPAGYLCRGYLHDRWLRIHSLPESKRYADTEIEYAEILRRHNQVASRILDDRECILFVTSFDEGEGDDYATPFPALRSAKYVRIPQLDALYDEEDQIWIRFYGAPLRWSEGEFDGLLREVADD